VGPPGFAIAADLLGTVEPGEIGGHPLAEGVLQEAGDRRDRLRGRVMLKLLGCPENEGHRDPPIVVRLTA
jgi:hypothetical protein